MQGRVIAITALFVVNVVAGGCGYLQSGRWEDDPANWSRAFKSSKPEDVVVLHSLYWRAPHWTWEGGYTFEIQANPTFRKDLFGRNQLVEVPGDRNDCFNPPAWFAPRPVGSYELWGYADEPRSNFRVLVDRDSGTIFLCDYQA